MLRCQPLRWQKACVTEKGTVVRAGESLRTHRDLKEKSTGDTSDRSHCSCGVLLPPVPSLQLEKTPTMTCSKRRASLCQQTQRGNLGVPS